MPALRVSWKQLGALATGFANRYRYDLFFRTGFHIIVLQVAFSVLTLVFVAVAFNYLYRDISVTLIQEIAQNISDHRGDTSAETIEKLQQVRTENLGMVIGVVVLATIIMGYVLARITLSPTREALEAQKQFIGNIAHELRTPLSIIKTNTEVALLDSNVDPSMRETLVSNIEELDRTSEIINNLLTFSRFVQPGRLEFKDVDLGAVVDTIVDKLTLLANRKHIDIITRKSDYRIVWGNTIALEQVVMNILKNAITYTPDNGRILITVEPNYRGFIELVIKDSGIGISRRDLFHIFEPFYRADRSRTRRAGGPGSGLGLAIVHELIKLHRGDIHVVSAPGRGTSVIALIPCGSRPNNEHVNEDRHLEGYDQVSANFSHAHHRIPTPPRHSPSPTHES